MFLIGISQVKNESDIIETTIRENLRVLDLLFVLDDSSEDSTLDILKRIASEHLPIVLVSLKDERLRLFHDHGKSMTYLMRWAVNYTLRNHISEEVDFIFPLDADEIIGCNRDTLENACKSLPTHHYGLLRWKNYLPYKGEFTSKNTLIDVFRSPEHERSNTFKAVIPADLAFSCSIRIGSHSITSHRLRLCPFIMESVPLLHFPVRSSNQVVRKSLLMAHKTSLRTSTSSRENYHLKEMAAEIRALNYNLTHDYLIALSSKYISCPKDVKCEPDKHIASLDNMHPLYPVSQDINTIKSLDKLLLDLTTSRYSSLVRLFFWIDSKINKIVDTLNPKDCYNAFEPLMVNGKT